MTRTLHVSLLVIVTMTLPACGFLDSLIPTGSDADAGMNADANADTDIDTEEEVTADADASVNEGTCGDGIIQQGEECDPGMGAPENRFCSATCRDMIFDPFGGRLPGSSSTGGDD